MRGVAREKDTEYSKRSKVALRSESSASVLSPLQVVLLGKISVNPVEEVQATVGSQRGHLEEDVEKRHILATIEAASGNKTKAASILGIERSTLDRKLARWAKRGGEKG